MMIEPPRVTSLKSTQPLPTFTNFGEDLNFVHDPRGYKSIVHEIAQSYLQHKDGKIIDHRLKLNKVPKHSYFEVNVHVYVYDEHFSIFNKRVIFPTNIELYY